MEIILSAIYNTAKKRMQIFSLNMDTEIVEG